MTLVLLAGSLLFSPARPAFAQGDTARVSYRTTDIVFFSAGRTAGVRVGDTVAVVSGAGAVLSQAVVLSAALRSASARLLAPEAAIAVGQLVRFVPHPVAELAGPHAPDSAAAALPAPAPEPDSLHPVAADTAVREPPPRPWASRPMRPVRQWSGGLNLVQIASSTGGLSALASTQTITGLTLVAPLARGVELRTRATGRWRSGAAARTTGMDGFSAMLYELEARLGTPGGRWSASLGRFLPMDAMALGYIDGARLELRLAPEQRLGVVAGFVPLVQRLGASTATRRAGVYWAFGGAGALSGSFAAAADWEGGARRRTLMASQAYWRPARSLSLSTYAEVDVGAPWQEFSGLQLTTAHLNLRADLPFGFRGSLGAESHQAIQLWESVAAGDTAAPPGRLNGLNASLGRDVLGFRLDFSGGLLKRASDATPTVRGMLSVARGPLFLTASGQHGDLFDYGALVARLLLPYRALPFNASLGASVSFTRSAGGALTQWRYSLQPELSRGLGGGFFATLGGDFGSYGGRSSTFLHAGVSYRFR